MSDGYGLVLLLRYLVKNDAKLDFVLEQMYSLLHVLL